MKNPTIVFMGTPEFAVPSLRTLIERQENIVGVVTQPDKPVGRGRQVRMTPVKQLALERQIPVFQPPKVKSPDFTKTMKGLAPDLVVVAAYGQIFSRALLDIAPRGYINVHSSLLPAYRGAAPINWALINGETQTGITIMLLDEGMDTGDMIMQESIAILPDDSAATLHDRLARLGADVLGKALDAARAGNWRSVPQNPEQATYAPMLKKNDGRINWGDEAGRIANRVRGMTPWPGCYTSLEGKLLKIHRAESLATKHDLSPGRIMAVTPGGIEVASGKGTLLLKEVQLEGKKRMAAADFLKGYALKPGTDLG